MNKNKASLKEIDKQKRTVFKPLLDNPFPQSQFPLIEPATQARILDYLLLLLKELGTYNDLSKTNKILPKPELYKYLAIGFNSTVERLESQMKSSTPERQKLKYVFVCKPDIQPQLLIQHFPNLCYLTSTKLIQLPKNSFGKLKEITGQNLNIFGIVPNDNLSTSFIELLDSIPDVDVQWLKDVKYQKVNVKMLKTTAPVRPKKVNGGKINEKLGKQTNVANKVIKPTKEIKTNSK